MYQPPQNQAIVYRRVSSKTQEDNESLRAQLIECQAYATRVGLHVVATDYDAITGTKTNERPGLQRVRERLRNNEATHLIVWKLDRLSRAENDDVDAVLLERELRQLGVLTHVTTLGRPFGDSPDDQFLLAITKAVAARERHNILDRTALGRHAKVARGAYLGSGIAPYGYQRVGEGRTVTLAPQETEAHVVRNIFTWYVQGDGDGPLSVRAILHRLHAAAILTPAEARPTRKHTRVRGSTQWNARTIYSMLANPLYRGQAAFQRYKREGTRVVEQPPEACIYVDVPALVPADVWHAAQHKRATGRMTSPRNRKNDYLMSQRILCSCGYRWSGATSITNGKTYMYYRCNSCDKMIVARPLCGMRAVPSARLDALAWEWVAALLLDEPRLIANMETQQRTAGHDRDVLTAAAADEQRGLLVLEQKHDRLIDGFMDGLITKHDYERKSVALDEQRRTHQARIDTLNARIAALAQPLPRDAVLDYARALRTRVHNAAFADKRALIELLNVTIEMQRDEAGVWAEIACEIGVDRLCVETPSTKSW